jgi:hypothetical protein
MAKDPTELAQENTQRAIQTANFGAEWITEFAEQNLGQSMAAINGLLTLTRKVLDGFGQQASAAQNHSLEFAETTFGNAFSFGKKILQVREPAEFAQAQSYFLSSQAQALSDHAKKLGSVIEEVNQTAKTSMQEARETARRQEAA